ncbi:MAG: ABC transporter substrate-binding protein [Burkholderiales bacterium]|jgi:phospholipid transport system substrate-binding protein|uniref:MlaC/ttg2D family ABC transporter substrate-binding protein n=1 Tax=Limnobacter sp. TaxID=2003368 RepID=UPI0039BC7E96|nr:ABC transporter substrate-binding protein [Burkholderiales bacterium]
MNIAVNKMLHWVAAAALGFGLITQPAMAQEVPANEFVEKFSNDVLAEIKARKQELLADPKKLDALIDQKVMPNVNFRKMTQLVVGRPWREATPAQREQITTEFRTLLVKTYSGALSQVGDQTLQVDRLRARPEDTDVIVNSRVIQKGAPPVDLAYRVEKKDGKWLIYDLSVLGLWLVDSYKAQFGTVLSSSGVEGLIQTLKTLNAKG